MKVTRKGRKPGLPRTEAANLRVLEREKRKKARKELLNFYAWQHRETKRERECPNRLLPFSVSHCNPKNIFFFRWSYIQLQANSWLGGWANGLASSWVSLATTWPSKDCCNILWESGQVVPF